MISSAHYFSEPLVSFVVPLYNTGDSLHRLLEAFRFLPIKEGYELVLVNDASPDGTGSRVAAMMASLPYRAVLIDMAKNFGEHAAVLEGYRHARGKFIVNLDDDLQNPVEEALRLVDHLQKHDCDVVYTWFAEKKHHPLRNFHGRNAIKFWFPFFNFFGLVPISIGNNQMIRAWIVRFKIII
jgi:undecaprenyl-phosphate 4-deoxy-4-formamido-L-arabinose transferase